ncbi:MAG: hypothetical protein LBH20_02165 [Treponema sp.]|jgi:predicted  nucleic acid-binding Zn-ribbon protein|nr:hypothetical protein [Treponema sp.]
MKKVLLCAAVLFFAFTAAVFAGRMEIEAAIKSYEDIVVEAENLSQKALIVEADFSALEERGKAAEAKIDVVQNEMEWLIQDAKQSAGLRARFNQAIATMMKNLLRY